MSRLSVNGIRPSLSLSLSLSLSRLFSSSLGLFLRVSFIRSPLASFFLLHLYDGYLCFFFISSQSLVFSNVFFFFIFVTLLSSSIFVSLLVQFSTRLSGFLFIRFIRTYTINVYRLCHLSIVPWVYHKLYPVVSKR